MGDDAELLARQAEWQKTRRSLSWAEKVRLAEAIRGSVIGLRATGPARTDDTDPGPSVPAAGSRPATDRN